ncbi:MAG: hypothetical protein J3K34DRAFT_406932 [Monoraphidium minutum]|nr:MAG: hypothetical protein J3K34DRAFT_406932 [Monoraphidium minutum]
MAPSTTERTAPPAVPSTFSISTGSASWGRPSRSACPSPASRRGGTSSTWRAPSRPTCRRCCRSAATAPSTTTTQTQTGCERPAGGGREPAARDRAAARVAASQHQSVMNALPPLQPSSPPPPAPAGEPDPPAWQVHPARRHAVVARRVAARPAQVQRRAGGGAQRQPHGRAEPSDGAHQLRRPAAVARGRRVRDVHVAVQRPRHRDLHHRRPPRGDRPLHRRLHLAAAHARQGRPAAHAGGDVQ